ncbi:unnamed protein product [Cylindrotheca closterium]|uniref:ubiquitinyl hydrolase 1 n=1 Tax=Cylindrotheca closterium TaxID=2856 RepID=A0AAD2FT97_9STRA|nr:unnamed protein product [Cylindrotheca closterium]
MTIAVQLLRQCFQNFRFSKVEISKPQNLSQHSKHSCALRLLIWCIYRWSRSLQVPEELKLKQEASFELDKFPSVEYRQSSAGPYLTSIEEQSVFCFTSVFEDSNEGVFETTASSDESEISQYIRKIERYDFQSLLRSEGRHCAPEFPLTNAKENLRVAEGTNTNIRERVLVDLQKSYELYTKLSKRSVDGPNFNVFAVQTEVCHKRQLVEERLLCTLNEALISREHYDFFSGSMQKLVAGDLLHMLDSTVFIHPRKRGYRDVILEMQPKLNDWALLCVLEDKIRRLQCFWQQKKEEELVRELECTRIWNPRRFPRWVAFEVEQQLQIRPEQFKTVSQLLQKPKGSLIQLNMGSGRTRVMVPMLVLEICRQKRKLVRINVLPSILQEALLFFQQSLVASVQHTKLFTLPFNRDNVLDEFTVKLMDEELRCCHKHGGCLVVTPHDRNSLLLKQHEVHIQLKGLPEVDIIDLFDESDAILEPKFQLVYAMGKKQNLPSCANRCTVFQSLLIMLTRGECATSSDLLEDPAAFYKSKNGAGLFNHFRLLKLSGEDKERLGRNLAEHFVRNPPSGFEWLEMVNREPDIQILVKMISDPTLNTSFYIMFYPLFRRFKDDILAARGFVAFGILLRTLESRWGVSYGLRHQKDSDTQMAVPYSASDTPKQRAEFSHPDVAIAYTNLSHLYEGLTVEQFRRAIDLLEAKGMSVKISTYAMWIEKVRPDVPIEEFNRFDMYEKVDPSNVPQFELM